MKSIMTPITAAASPKPHSKQLSSRPRKSVGFSPKTEIKLYWRDEEDNDVRYRLYKAKLMPAQGVPADADEVEEVEEADEVIERIVEARRTEDTADSTRKAADETEAVQMQTTPQLSFGRKRKLGSDVVESPSKRHQSASTPVTSALFKVSEEEVKIAEAKAVSGRMVTIAELAVLNASSGGALPSQPAPVPVHGVKWLRRTASNEVPTMSKRQKLDHCPDNEEVGEEAQRKAIEDAVWARFEIRTMLSALTPSIATSRTSEMSSVTQSPSMPSGPLNTRSSKKPRGYPHPQSYQQVKGYPWTKPSYMPDLQRWDCRQKWFEDFVEPGEKVMDWRQYRSKWWPVVENAISEANDESLASYKRAAAVETLKALQEGVFWIEVLEVTNPMLENFWWDSTLSTEEQIARCSPFWSELEPMFNYRGKLAGKMVEAVSTFLRIAPGKAAENKHKLKMKKKLLWHNRRPRTQEDFFRWWRRSDHAYMNELWRNERTDLMTASLTPNDEYEAQGKTGYLPMAQWLETLDDAITPAIVAGLPRTKPHDNDEILPTIGKVADFRIKDDPNCTPIRISPQDVQPWRFEEIHEKESPRDSAEATETSPTQQCPRTKLLRKLWTAKPGETL